VPTRSVLSCRAFFRKTFAAFPDFEIAVDRIVADATSAAVQWHATGTFTGGPFQGILATWRRVKLRGVDVMEVADGLIQHNTVFTTTVLPWRARSGCCPFRVLAPTEPWSSCSTQSLG
jgi:predicted ester cyclase